MKNKSLLFLFILFIFATVNSVFAVAPMRSMTLGGATGLITLPTARTGWETGTFGLDFGYHHITDQDGTHIPKIQLNMFNRWELGAAYDTQVENGEDILFNTKLRFFPWSGSGYDTSLAIGGNYQSLKGPKGTNDSVTDTQYQAYLAVTFAGSLFNWPAETSFAIGKTFTDPSNENIDFGMGFQVSFLPQVFRHYVNWIMEFGNFSYSGHAYGAQTPRGIFNTGFRLDLLRGLGKNIHLKIDVLMLDALDENRSYSYGAVFGMIF